MNKNNVFPSMASAIQIEQRVNRIYDHLYANAPVRTPEGISYEVGKILHAAMFMEGEKIAGSAFDFSKQEIRKLETGDSNLSPIIANEVQRAFARMNESWEIYPKEDRINISDFDLGYVCSALAGILVSDTSRDVFGDALEIFRSQWAKRNGGQFFTDQRVTHLAMTLLQFNPLTGDDLVDICSGTGGFLLAGVNYVRRLLEDQDPDISEAEIVKVAYNAIKGQEVDKDVCNIANATLKSRLGNDKAPSVSLGNSLLPDVFAPEKHGRIVFGSHACAATNPPFGTKITIKDPSILRNYELAYTSNRLASRAPDILFLEQNIRLLKLGVGRLAIVAPYQILSGPQSLYIRDWLLRNAQILAVVDLPADTFQPHTGTKACLLVVRRRQVPLVDIDLSGDPDIFMSMPKWIGHDRRGNPTYKRSPDGSITGEILTDFNEVEESFKTFLLGNDPSSLHAESFVINPQLIVKDQALRLNALFHKPSSVSVKSAESGDENHKDLWKTVKINTVVNKIFYPGRFKRNYIDRTEDAIPFLGGTNISQLIINTDKWLSPNDPKLPDLSVEKGWILVTRSGSTGIVSIVPEAWDGYAISEHVIRIIPNNDAIPAEYIYTFLRTRYAQEALSRGVYGSVIDEITPEFIGEIEMPVPRSKQLLDDIVSSVRRSEEARQVAINSLTSSVETLDKLMAT